MYVIIREWLDSLEVCDEQKQDFIRNGKHVLEGTIEVHLTNFFN